MENFPPGHGAIDSWMKTKLHGEIFMVMKRVVAERVEGKILRKITGVMDSQHLLQEWIKVLLMLLWRKSHEVWI